MISLFRRSTRKLAPGRSETLAQRDIRHPDCGVADVSTARNTPGYRCVGHRTQPGWPAPLRSALPTLLAKFRVTTSAKSVELAHAYRVPLPKPARSPKRDPEKSTARRPEEIQQSSRLRPAHNGWIFDNTGISRQHGYKDSVSISRRIARPLLASIFIAEGWSAIRNPNTAGKALEPPSPARRERRGASDR